MVGGLGTTVYVQRLKAQNSDLNGKVVSLTLDREILQLKITADAEVKAKDDARAAQAEAELTTFKERAQEALDALKNPDRLCLDSDDTRSLRTLFGDPVR